MEENSGRSKQMNKHGKVWGHTQCIHSNSAYEFHRIEIKENAFCSIHKHEHKWNGFFVESGLLMIRVWKNNYDLIDETILRPGDFTSVAPGEFHQFHALQPTIAFETYWSQELNMNDIVRQTVGGS